LPQKTDFKSFMAPAITTSIEPWLSVPNGEAAIHFYKTAFGTEETYRMEAPDGGLVVRLEVDKAGFWISGGSDGDRGDRGVEGGHMRLVLIVSEPDALYNRAIAAGATEVLPVGEEYGWRLGRLVDPFGFHWEIGHPLAH
jgi:PhnB protein